MNLSEKNVSSFYDTNSTGPEVSNNKKYFLSFINSSNMSQSKFKILNAIDKKDMIFSKEGDLNDKNNFNKKHNTNSILSKLLNNKIRQEKFFFKRNEDLSFHSNNMTNANANLGNIFLEQIKNKAKQDNNFQISYNFNNKDNENNTNYENNENDKSKKINFAIESHQLINSLLKNQKKNSNKKSISKGKVASNASEISFSSSFDNNINCNLFPAKNLEISSPSKESIELSCTNTNNNVNNENAPTSNNLYLQNLNKNKIHKQNSIPINTQKENHIDNITYENNLYFGLNKENNDFNSPKITYYKKSANEMFFRNKKYSNSPLRMADVFMLKKHHSINPYNNTEKNNGDSASLCKKYLKKIFLIKPNDSKMKNDELKNEDEIKVIRQKEKIKKKEIKSEDK